MPRFTQTSICRADQVDETVRRIVASRQRDRVDASNSGQIVLINVSITSHQPGYVVVCCVLGNSNEE